MNKKSKINKKDEGVIFNINKEIEKLDRIIQEDNLNDFDIRSHREDLENLKEDTVKRFARANRHENLILVFTLLLLITIAGLVYFLEEFRGQNTKLSSDNDSIANTILGKKDGEYFFYRRNDKIVTYKDLKEERDSAILLVDTEKEKREKLYKEKDSLHSIFKRDSIYLKLAKRTYSLSFSEKENKEKSTTTYSVESPKMDTAILLLQFFRNKVIVEHDPKEDTWSITDIR